MVKGTARYEIFTKGTAFRANRSSELVTLTESTFEGCKFVCKAVFQVGERLRLHIPRQGLIEVQVEWSYGSTYGVSFLNECHV